jgi:hypothetical protein
MKSYPQRLSDDLSNYFAKMFPLYGATDAEYHETNMHRDNCRKAFDDAVLRQSHKPLAEQTKFNVRDTELFATDPDWAWETLELFNRAVASQRAPTVRKGDKGRMPAESLRLVRSQGRVARYAALMPVPRRYV